MIQCPSGCGGLRVEQVDARQEWTETLYVCPICEEEYLHREDYEIQSSKILSQTLTDKDGTECYF